MIHFGPKTGGRTFNYDVFMYFIVATPGIAFCKLFEATKLVFEKSKVPVRVVSVLEPFPHEHETPIYPIARDSMVGVRNDLAKFGFGVRMHHFVSIEDENPFMTIWEMIERPIFLFWPSAIKVKLNNLRAVFLCDLLRAVIACGIDYEELISPCDGREATRKVERFVFDRDENGYGNF